MKRQGFIYEKIYSMENLNRALDLAARGKKNNGFVRQVLKNREVLLSHLHDELMEETFNFGKNKHKVIVEPSCQKQRDLTIPRFFPDYVVHWAVCLQLQPILMRGMYRYSCGSVPGRGGLFGKKYIEKIIYTDKKAKYVLKLDLKKFFQHVSHDKLMELLRGKIKDEKALRLLGKIIDAGGDGLPIGYYTSQWLANFYLEKLDHYIKEELGVKYYVRYVDDMVLIDTNKRKLHKVRLQIAQFLEDGGYGVTIKENWQLWRRSSRPIDFLGYRFYEDKTMLRKRIFLRLNRKVRKVQKRGYCTVQAARGISSLLGWLKHIPGGKSYYLNYIKPIISKREVSRIISAFAKLQTRRSTA